MKALFLIPILALFLSPLATADNHGGEKAAAEKTPDVTLVVTGNDTMQFDKKALEVTEGQIVKLTLKNIGSLPKAAMGHNLVLLQSGVDLVKFALAASKPENRDREFLPADEETQKKMIAHTKLLGPGEEDSIMFTAPAPGKYEYLCTFPGHFAIMRGVLTVKAK